VSEVPLPIGKSLLRVLPLLRPGQAHRKRWIGGERWLRKYDTHALNATVHCSIGRGDAIADGGGCLIPRRRGSGLLIAMSGRSLKAMAESKARLLARLRAWEAEREGDWHGMVYLAEEAIGALRTALQKLDPVRMKTEAESPARWQPASYSPVNSGHLYFRTCSRISSASGRGAGGRQRGAGDRG
jgi:hypothetical protein